MIDEKRYCNNCEGRTCLRCGGDGIRIVRDYRKKEDAKPIEKKIITRLHWQRVMNKLLAKGMTRNSAYDWMSEKFTTEDEDHYTGDYTTNFDADKDM